MIFWPFFVEFWVIFGNHFGGLSWVSNNIPNKGLFYSFKRSSKTYIKQLFDSTSYFCKNFGPKMKILPKNRDFSNPKINFSRNPNELSSYFFFYFIKWTINNARFKIVFSKNVWIKKYRSKYRKISWFWKIFEICVGWSDRVMWPSKLKHVTHWF